MFLEEHLGEKVGLNYLLEILGIKRRGFLELLNEHKRRYLCHEGYQFEDNPCTCGSAGRLLLRRVPSIDYQGRPYHITRLIGGEIENRMGNLFGITQSMNRPNRLKLF